MSLQKWMDEGRLQPHTTNHREIKNLFDIVDRDIKDALIKELSVDRRFAIAYNAALQLATIVIHSAGYRVKNGQGHHWVTVSSFPDIMKDNEQRQRLDYFNVCRAKRNLTDYDRGGEIAEYELKELLKEVIDFRNDVIQWMKNKSSFNIFE